MSLGKDLKIVPSVIKLLRRLLIQEEYDEVYKSLRRTQYHLDPWAELAEFERLLWSIPRKRQLIFSLFFLGKKIPYFKAVHFLDKDLIKGLLEVNVLRLEDEELVSNGFSIVPYQNLFFLVDLVYLLPNAVRRAPEAYIGLDSYICSNYHFNPSSNDKILDLCCGPGFQMISALKGAQSCLGVEINPFAKTVCQFNIILNEMTERAEVRCGSLYGPVKDERFSIIYANPPFIPIPKGIDYPIPGHGGEDGTDILKKIYEEMDHHLLNESRSVVYCEALGDKNGIFFLSWLQEIAKKNKWRAEVFVLGRVYYLEQIRRMVNLLLSTYDNLHKEKLIKVWLKYYEEVVPKARYLYSLVIKTYKIPHGSFDFTVNNFFNPIDPNDTFVSNKEIIWSMFIRFGL